MIEADVAVIGGGPAGVAAAREAARAGAAVVLIADRIGGRAAHATTIPYRAWMRAADPLDWPGLRREAAERARAWEERVGLSLEDLGVDLARGRGRFVAPDRIAVEGWEDVVFDRAVIAAGATPRALPGDAPDGVRVCTPDSLFDRPELPRQVLVVGGGVAGAELAHLLSRAGSRVTWLMDEVGILPSFDRELAEAVGDVLMARGVRLVHGKDVTRIAFADPGAHATLEGGRTYAAELAVVAVGSAPALRGLGLEAAGIDAPGVLTVDASCRTSVPRVFAAGEVTGITRDVAGAEAMGRTAGRAAAGLEHAPFDPAHVPHVAFTEPQIAQVGLTPDRAAGREIVVHTLRLEETIGGLLDHVGEHADAKGFVRVVCDSVDGTLLGASAAGRGAAEAVGAISIGLALGARDTTLGRASAAVPSRLDALLRAVR